MHSIKGIYTSEIIYLSSIVILKQVFSFFHRYEQKAIVDYALFLI